MAVDVDFYAPRIFFVQLDDTIFCVLPSYPKRVCITQSTIMLILRVHTWVVVCVVDYLNVTREENHRDRKRQSERRINKTH